MRVRRTGAFVECVQRRRLTPYHGAVSAAERVSVQVTGGVAEVRLTRPDKLNALDLPMFEGLRRASDGLAADPGVRAVVLSGEGRGFCAGLDFGSFMSMAGDGGGGDVRRDLGARLPGRITNLAQQVAHGWRELAVPTIAAVHGVALGGGLQIALGADIRIVAPDAELSVLEIRWGLVPDMTGTWTLPRLVGPDVAKELTWTGRRVRGEEAVRIGLATRVADDPRAAALALAGEIARANPHAIRAGKALLEASLGAAAGDQYLAESAAMSGLIGSSNQVEAVRAFFDKREPVFADPERPAGS